MGSYCEEAIAYGGYLRVRIGVLELAKLALKLVKLLCSLPLLTGVVQQDGIVEVDQRVFPAHRGSSVQ